MIKVSGHIITPDIFPDKTQQVWKLPAEVLSSTRIDWQYEGDHELITLAQLTDLMLVESDNMNRPVVHIDFLPYGRQDKDISNMSTFGLSTFMRMLACMRIGGVVTVDVHSDVAKTTAIREGLNFISIFPYAEISNAIKASESDVLCFPDKGAMARYHRHFDQPAVYCEKVRDQLTSEILGLELVSTIDINGKNLLIVDDIIDGGATFIRVSKLLMSSGASKVSLYGSHAICSKGVDILHEAGIKEIYSLQGLKSKRGKVE